MSDTPNLITTKIWDTTLRSVRFIKAYTGESQASIMDRLASAELQRLRQEDAAASDDLVTDYLSKLAK